MQPDSPRECLRLNIASDINQVLRRVGVIDALYGLFNDRTFVKISCDIMGGCADQLHPALIGAVIGLCAFKAW